MRRGRFGHRHAAGRMPCEDTQGGVDREAAIGVVPLGAGSGLERSRTQGLWQELGRPRLELTSGPRAWGLLPF